MSKKKEIFLDSKNLVALSVSNVRVFVFLFVKRQNAWHVWCYGVISFLKSFCAIERFQLYIKSYSLML